MSDLNRRDFLRASGAATGGLLSSSFLSFATPPSDQGFLPVKFTGDGREISPEGYIPIYRELLSKGKIKADQYSLKGSVEELEIKMAQMLGKESALFMPTGTLANQLALRTLAGEKSRVLVQAESHLYNDTGDCMSVLNHIHLVPLGHGKAGFSPEEAEEAVKRSENGRVQNPVGAVSIETPVRRKYNEMFGFDELKKISAYLRGKNIPLHLDGARLLMESAFSGIPVKEYTSLADTVYVSLYKGIDAPSGAILAGPATLIRPLYHARRMFGGGLPQAWPYAALALHFAHTFESEYAQSVVIARELTGLLEKENKFRIIPIPRATTIFKLQLKSGDPEKFRRTLQSLHVFLPEADKEGIFLMRINTTLLNTTAGRLFAAMRES